MNRLLILLFGIVSTTAVFILLILLYRYANVSDDTLHRGGDDLHSPAGETKSVEGPKKWLKDLASRKKPSYSYAVSEMEISLPLKKRPEPKTSFRLILRNLDSYKMFCIKQLFERNGIDFSVFKKRGEAVLVLHDIDSDERSRIVRMVREYDVKTEIEKYTKD
ncbi:hypothetical protein NNO_1434 [Hydrogenimonas sp.]|nr:hypothetical protein NNO_1434 [Hydrogenimonas sp.]